MLVLPTITAPAARRRATTGASSPAGGASLERLGAGKRRLARHVAEVLDRDRDAGERRGHDARLAQHVAGVGRGQRLRLVDLDEGALALALGVLDAGERFFGELARGGAAGGQVCCELLNRRVGHRTPCCHLRAVLHQILDHARIGEGRGVAEIAEIVLGDLAQDAAHDLARARLGQAGRPLDDVGRGDRPDLLAHPGDQLLAQLVGRVLAGLERDVGVDALALDVVREADDGGLGHLQVGDQGAFDLGGADAMARDVDHVVDPAGDPVVAVLRRGARRRR